MEINSQPQIIVSTPTSTNSKDSQQIYISTTVYEKKNQIKYTSNITNLYLVQLYIQSDHINHLYCGNVI